jgi:Mg-chelatase subunit ChlD
MKTRVFNLIILDESGSMSAIEKQAIDGVNETVQTIRAAQKKHEGQEHFVSLVSFNSDEVKTIYDKVEAERVEELTNEQYCPGCCTPLYDAMGNSLNKLRKSVADDDMVLVTIITDGYENASKEYNQPAIKKLVDELKAKGWVFTYIGANQDVEKVAATISVTNTLNFCTTAEGTDAMFAQERSSRSRFFDRLSFCKSKEDRDCLAEDDYFDK